MSNKLTRIISEIPARMRQHVGRTFQSMSDRNFRIYSLGMFVSSCGTWMQSVALSWLVYRLTGSAAALGIVSFANSLPLLLLTFVGGMAADRFDKRKLLFVTNSIAMLQALILTILVATDQATIGWVIGLSVMLGIVTAFEVPTRQSTVPLLIQDEKNIHNAIGLASATFHVSRMIGPALAGLAIAQFGEFICFVLNTVSFVAALAAIWAVRLRETKPKVSTHADTVDTARSAEPSKSDKVAPAPAFWEVFRSPGVLTLLILAAFVSTFGMQYSVLMPVIVDKILHGQSEQFGFLSAAGGMGSLCGALVIASLSQKGLRKRLGLAALLLSLSVAALAYSTVFGLSAICIMVSGACLSMHWSGGNSLMQQCAQPATRGRLMGLYTTFTLGLAPFTAIIAGWTAEQFGVHTALLLASGGMLVGALLYLFISRNLDDTCKGE
ncbi:MAG: MFS transporter [Candidatus Obscuribacter sp.]|nr:MFS transporter [Candidatus Obscuribacter sp.]MBK7840179.1 MFS transporter [Candidatus Obscuribacter sp.]MBK9204317.1 MFS transporter [Candidatus Obscuribacter sp.]MBK9770942.1 MFS transporter [Candidatus Obscuribacter sp.]MBL0186481.1 MFS transporter [Candidatus Obscuribacter sp.]